MSAELYNEIRTFISFGADDEARLLALKPLIAKHGGSITKRFYDVLGATPTTAALIAGRVEKLQTTHSNWMTYLVSGPWDEAWFDQQVRIGHVHVMVGIPPLHVELTFGLLRNYIADAIKEEMGGTKEALDHVASVVKALDVALALVNHAYGTERIERLSAFTGFSKKLIENCIAQKPRK